MYIYRIFFGLIIFIGVYSNLLSLSTFLRNRIRCTVPGVYLISYSGSGLFLMLCLFLTVLSPIRSNDYFVQMWTCHGFLYLSYVMIYTGMLISALLTIEHVLNFAFELDKFRSPRYALLTIFLCVLLSSIGNLERVVPRKIGTNQFGRFYCANQNTDDHRFWFRHDPIALNIFLLLTCIVHWICLTGILATRSSHKCLRRLVTDRHYLLPCIIVTLCLLSYSICRNLVLSTSSFTRYSDLLSFLFLCTPHICTHWIYIVPNGFYRRESHQIWFYRIFCCCFYQRKRQVQQFDLIQQLWQRRTSLETTMTIATLDDHWLASELYSNKIKMQV